MKDRVLNEDGQIEIVHNRRPAGQPIADLLTLEKGKCATMRLEIRDLKLKCDELQIKLIDAEERALKTELPKKKTKKAVKK